MICARIKALMGTKIYAQVKLLGYYYQITLTELVQLSFKVKFPDFPINMEPIALYTFVLGV